MRAAVGPDAIVHGSDRPYATPSTPALGDAAARAIHTVNPGRLLAAIPQEVSA